MGPDVMILDFLTFSFEPAFSLSSFTLIKRLFSFSLLSAIRVVSPTYLRLLIFLPAVLIPACESFNPAFSWGTLQFRSVQFSCSVASDSLWPHELQHARLPSPSPTPGACSNSCPLSWWCHPTISSSVIIPFSSCLQSFPASGSFPMSQFFPSRGQSIGVSASASVLPMSIQD